MRGLAGKPQNLAFFGKNGGLVKKRQFEGMGLGEGLNHECLPCLGEGMRPNIILDALAWPDAW
jgi:hypothetical protein